MAYLDTGRANAAASVTRRPWAARLLQAHAASIGRPALEQALRAHAREVRQMLAAALLAAAAIVAVAVALLVRS
jgi:hypothetical protein